MTALHKPALETPWAVRTHEEMKEVLMSPEAPGPSVHYYMIRGGAERKNITILESGTIGGEYIKTYGHYHVDGIGETYTIVQGKGIILLQERKKTEDGNVLNDQVSSVRALFVSAGSVVTIPGDAGHLIINIGPEWLVTVDDSPVAIAHEDESSWPAHADYQVVKDLRGFAYYVVEKDGVLVFVKNPLYKDVPDIIIDTDS